MNLSRPPVRPRRTIRLRLTLFYGAAFLLSGAALLAITYLLVRFTFPAASVHTYAATRPGPGPSPGRLPSLAVAGAQRDADLNRLLLVSGIALAAMAVASLALGWLIAGRFLRPLRTLTAAARDVSSASLDRRIALAGPDDELKELGDTFDGLLARLERSFRSQRQFVANASHELRTPLTLQRALIEEALTDPESTTGSFRDTCERLLAANASQDRLIEALATLATSERGIERAQPIDLAVLAERAHAARRAEADRLDVRVATDLAPAPAVGDPDLAERLIANLLDNALRHNIPGGEAELVTATAGSGESTVRVTNTGPPVPADAVEDLFRPFRRLGGARTRRGDGHGLGLSIVSAIAAAHHAAIAVRPRPAGGLDIEVRFPGPDG